MNDQKALLAALNFQWAAGVATTIGDHPLDRLADSARGPFPHKAAAASPDPTPCPTPKSPPHPNRPQAQSAAQRGRAAQTTQVPLIQFEPGAPLVGGTMAGLPHAQSAARAANSIPDLLRAIEGFEHCELKKTARNTVVLDGNPAAQVLLVGEAPGAQEDAEGLPFVGAAGQLLNNMLAAIGLKRETDVLISNSVFWRPLGNRTPNDGELTICRPFLVRLIDLQQPKIIVTLGAAASKSLLGVTGITRARGKWVRYVSEDGQSEDGQAIPALPMLHPAYLLRMPTTKREAWIDLRNLKAKLENLP